MTALHTLLGKPGRVMIHGAPEGRDAQLLGEVVAGGFIKSLIHVCADDGRLERFRAALQFFAPDIEVLVLPAWDCLPYDRVSPHPELVSRRIDTLTRLAASEGTRRIVLTTVNALVQRLPPRKLFRERTLELKKGGRIPTDRVLSFLQSNGYVRTETVREAGEFAVRGGIVDLFPAGAAEPLRIDFFGDEIDGIRRFDPLTQRSTATLGEIGLKPVSEVLLDEAAIRRFRSRYRDLFGTVDPEDALYAAVSEGRRHIGMEHWLPLYYETLETLFDYLPNSAVSLDFRAEEIHATRLESIAEFYGARRTLTGARQGQVSTVYKPVEPDLMFLDDAEWRRLLGQRAVAVLTPFPPPPGSGVESFDGGGRPGLNFAEARANPKLNVFEAVRDRVAQLQQAGRKVAIAAYTTGAAERLRHVLTERGIEGVEPVKDAAALQALSPRRVGLAVLPIEQGYEAGKLTLISEQDILGDRLTRPVRRRSNIDKFIAEVSALSVGDLVVHAEHGIGRYSGLETLDVGGAAHDCLKVVYQGDDKLFVPVENIEILSRFGSEDAEAQLDRLGGVAWQSRKARVKQRIKDIAGQLIKVAAEREVREGEAITSPAGLYDEFAARFPYPETEDQLNAIADTLSDLASGRPMDRLICGDVGFGKTEVALRAGFVAAMMGFQVAVVVPTTLLARQHYKTFATRLQGLPLKVGQLSRLVTAKEAAEMRQGLAEGTLDVVVGTHALLAKTVEFKRLGLVIVDEEQHFGVTQKERLKRLKANVHVLTLTATPIPRTLQMALTGVREMSLIATPPVDRLAVRTFVMPYDPVVIREAILRERNRGGQIFYIVPRIKDLDEVKEALTQLVPEIKVAMAHGRMAPTELEDVMAAFDDGRYDLLLATNIVESGLDIPGANTIILHRADMFGLAPLYQLRGRVGRGKIRAYAYLTVPPTKVLSETAMKRLEVMQTLDTLGAGFQLASHDLDIRGAGNLLGDEQSGHIREVGIELYQQLLEEAVAEARATAAGEDAPTEDWTPTITLGTSVLIPETYVADLGVRLGLYRRLATLIDAAEIDAFAAELIDRFGSLPQEVENLLQTVAIKRLCKAAGVEKIEAGPKGAVVTFRNNQFADPAKLIDLIQKSAGTMKVRPDQRLVLMRDLEDQKIRVVQVQRLLGKLADLATGAHPEAKPGLPPPTAVLVKRPPPPPPKSPTPPHRSRSAVNKVFGRR